MGGCAGRPSLRRGPTAAASEPALVADLEWLSDHELLGAELSQFLLLVHGRRRNRDHQCYVRHAPSVGNPVFTNEDDYPEVRFPDAWYQLLALFRLWNIVEYWSPYRDLVDGDWRVVLAEFIPRLASAADRAQYTRELLALVGRVADTHTNLWGALDHRPPAGSYQVPAAVRFVVDPAGAERAVVGRAQDGAGLVRGDVIVAVDGDDVDALVRAWEPYYAASNRPTQLRDIARSMLAGPPSDARVGIVRGGRRWTISTPRIPRSSVDLELERRDRRGGTFQLLSTEVAYLRLSSVVAADCAEYVRSAHRTSGLVIDLRSYPSEFVPFTLGQHLVFEDSPFARFTTAHAANPGVFTMGPPVVIRPATPRYDGQVVVLVDEATQSQAEYTALALRQAPNAVVVGSTTAGADGNVSTVPLPGGLKTTISGVGVFTADGQPTQRVGIHIDVPARPTAAGLRDGRDEVLEMGICEILNRQAPDERIIAMARV